jgi:hypothetical protein
MALPPVFDGCSIADDEAGQARPGSSEPAFRILHRGGARSVFIGELEKTIAQIRVGGIAGEAAATLGLLEKV